VGKERQCTHERKRMETKKSRKQGVWGGKVRVQGTSDTEKGKRKKKKTKTQARKGPTREKLLCHESSRGTGPTADGEGRKPSAVLTRFPLTGGERGNPRKGFPTESTPPSFWNELWDNKKD